MVNISIQLTIFTYYDDELQVWLKKENKQHHNLTITLPTNIQKTELTSLIKQTIKQRLNLDINTDQINLIHPVNKIENATITFPILVQLNNEIANTLSNSTNLLYKNQSFYPLRSLPLQLNQLDRQVINISYQEIKKRLNYYSISGVAPMLPEKFTARSLSAMLSNITGNYIKYNNIKRDLAPELKIIGKDHSKRGRPVNIFTYQKPTKVVNAHDIPKTKYQEK